MAKKGLIDFFDYNGTTYCIYEPDTGSYAVMSMDRLLEHTAENYEYLCMNHKHHTTTYYSVEDARQDILAGDIVYPLC